MSERHRRTRKNPFLYFFCRLHFPASFQVVLPRSLWPAPCVCQFERHFSGGNNKVVFWTSRGVRMANKYLIKMVRLLMFAPVCSNRSKLWDCKTKRLPITFLTLVQHQLLKTGRFMRQKVLLLLFGFRFSTLAALHYSFFYQVELLCFIVAVLQFHLFWKALLDLQCWSVRYDCRPAVVSYTSNHSVILLLLWIQIKLDSFLWIL